jgi:hypothetical protein
MDCLFSKGIKKTQARINLESGVGFIKVETIIWQALINKNCTSR